MMVRQAHQPIGTGKETKRILLKSNNPEKQGRFSYPFCPDSYLVFENVCVSSLIKIKNLFFRENAKRKHPPLNITQEGAKCQG